MLTVTVICAFINVSYAIYFAVLTNTLINIFWTANIFGNSKSKASSKPFGFADNQLLTEKESKKTIAKLIGPKRPLL